VRLSRILRDYSDAGGVNTLLSLWGFLDDGSFLTKAGHLGIVYSLRGVDVDGVTHAQRRALTHRMEAALRQLDERTSSSGRSIHSSRRSAPNPWLRKP
jgi:hypothetical protein